MSRRTAFVFGYHGKGNLGDDIFLRYACSYLRDTWDVNTIMVSAPEGTIPTEVENVQIVPVDRQRYRLRRLRWVHLIRKAWSSSVMLWCGGSIFRQQPYGLLMIILMLWKGWSRDRRIIGLGVSIGPFRRRKDSRRCAQVLRIFDKVWVRDTSSIDWARCNGLASRVDMGHDLALAWFSRRQSQSVEKVDCSSAGSKLGIALNGEAIEFLGKQPEGSNLGSFLIHEIKSGSFASAYVLATCIDKEKGDQRASETVCTFLKHSGVLVEYYEYVPHEPEAFLQRLGECSTVVASRMHAGVLSLMLGKRVVQLAYDQKIIDFLATEGLMDEEMVEIQSQKGGESLTAYCMSGASCAGRLLSVGCKMDRLYKEMET